MKDRSDYAQRGGQSEVFCSFVLNHLIGTCNLRWIHMIGDVGII